MRGGVIALLLALPAVALAAPKPPPTWQASIREADRTRLAGLWNAWTRALNQAETAGDGAALRALAPVATAPVATASATSLAALPGAGDYQCRSIKIGSHDNGGPAMPGPMVMIGEFAPCRISAGKGLLWFEQLTGRQRIGGTLYPDSGRMVFLGAMALTGEQAMVRYGADPDRDQLGVLRALGDNHWRLELPWPRWQSNLEIIEIKPA